MLTSLGGFAVRLKNASEERIPHGCVVTMSDFADESIKIQDGFDNGIGLANGAIEPGLYGWIVTAGVAEALLEDGHNATRGYWVKPSSTPGRIVAITDPGSVVLYGKYRELGHCLETKRSGTGVLVKVMLHFL